jgi:hypothetical protein
MRLRLTKTPWLALAVGLLLTTSAVAAPVYGTAAALTGSRTEGTPGLVTGGAYAADSLVQGISWEIASLGGGLWSYSYTLTNFDGAAGAGAGLSHWILDLTDDCYRPGDPACVTGIGGPVGSSEVKDYNPGDASNPGLVASIVGIKFNVADGGDATYTFTSNRAPVWGDVYFKGGRDHYAYNSGLADHLSGDVGGFIARPNGTGDERVPEPGTLVLFGAALAAGVGRLRRRR